MLSPGFQPRDRQGDHQGDYGSEEDGRRPEHLPVTTHEGGDSREGKDENRQEPDRKDDQLRSAWLPHANGRLRSALWRWARAGDIEWPARSSGLAESAKP